MIELDEIEWNKFITRAENFYWNSEGIKQQMLEGRPYYESICYIKNHILKYDIPKKQNRTHFLDVCFNLIYSATTENEKGFAYFLNDSPLHDSVYEACFLKTLCTFLHETIRVKGKSLKRFVYDNSIDDYNKKNTKHYCPFNAPTQELESDAQTLRKSRNRLLSSRPVYNKRPEGSAMSMDLEHEWSLKYALETESNILQDTFKRIGNLYKDILQACDAPRDDAFNEKIQAAYNSFYSKLNKIQYKNYIALQKFFYEQLDKDKKFFGINFYRLEKEQRPYITINEIKQLLACETIADEKTILFKSVMLSDICFPKVYEDIAALPDLRTIHDQPPLFHALCQWTIPANCLIIDELVENNYLGDDWYDFLCQTINELAKKVFYNPVDIDFTVSPKSQEYFVKIFSSFATNYIFQHTDIKIT